MIISDFKGFYNDILPDLRMVKRTEKIMSDMLTFGMVTINQFCQTHSDKAGAYRLFNNKKVSTKNLIEGLMKNCVANQSGNHLLCIQDTTEFNFTPHLKRIGVDDANIGPIGKNTNAGFFCHPMLVLDPVLEVPLGFANIHLWNRDWNKEDKNTRNYKSQPIELKESYRWIDNAQKTKTALSNTQMLTIIGDREADIYEELITVPDEKTHLLIRSSINRKLYESEQKLFETLTSQKSQMFYEIKIKGNKKRKDRVAKMTLKYVQVNIQKPNKANLKEYPDYKQMWAIEAKELDETVPENEDAILWRLLTTHDIRNEQDALQCVNWYSKRWYIEELFRVLKSKGLKLEEAQLETGTGLQKLLVLALQVALRTMTLKLSMIEEKDIDPTIMFSQEHLIYMGLLNQRVGGNTEKLQNPYNEKSLAWCAWCIARLSGWSGYISQGPPGYISIKLGLDTFYKEYEGFKIAHELFKKDVCKG